MATPSYNGGFTQPEEEIFYSTYEPTKEEIIEYAVKIGIDPEKEANIIYLARQGLLHPLPENWKPCYSKQVKAYYYYDRITKKSQWEHPIDVLYRAKVIDARKALALDKSDSTSFGDSGFRSLKSNNNKSTATFNTNDHTKDPDCGSSLAMSNQQLKSNKTNQDAKKPGQLDGCTNLIASPSPANEESDSNKENNSQDAAVGVAKKQSNSDTAIGFTKKLSFNTDASGHDTRSEVKDTVKSITDSKVGSALYGFTITGTGSQFLKSNKKLEFGSFDLGRKPESEMKGILRDTSLSYVRSKSTPNDDSGNDERKSVRFDIDIDAEQSANGMKGETYSALDADEPYVQQKYVDDEADGNIDDRDEVEDRFDDQEKEDDGSADRLKQTSSSESSEPESEVLTGVGLKIVNEGKPFATAVSTSKAINDDLLEDRDLDSLRFLRHSIDQERERYKAKLEEELRSLAALEESKMQIELTSERCRYEELLSKERQRIQDQHQQNIDEIKEFYQAKLSELKADYEEENAKEYAVYQETLQEEFDRRVKEVTNTHRATMAKLQKNHDEIVEELERDLKMEEELLKKEHSTNLAEIKIKLTHELEMERQRMRETGEDRLYEKVRCEKRLLEDKYKCLKEKYTRLKTDVRISLERRKKRREQQQQQQQHSLLSNSYETDDRTNSKPLPSYSYEVGKGISGSSSVKPSLMMSDKSQPHSNASQGAATKRILTTGDSYAMDSKHNVVHLSGAVSAESRKSAFILNHTNNNNNNNNTQKHQADDTSQSETRYSKHYFQVKNIFGSVQHEDNFSSDSEFHKMSCDNGGVENSCSSSFTGAATAATRPKRRIFTKTKSSSTSKLNSSKHEREAGVKPYTPVENLRIQLKKLEELEDQIPDCNLDAPYHLRYPFVNNITNVDNSKTTASVCMHGDAGETEVATTTDRSELEFFKHRILLERDSVMRAKESLRAQKNVFKSKQRDIAVKHAIKNKQTVDQIFHEEKELTEMEVSLHRTRALLGEKVIRLRHLENSLQKLSEKEHPIRAGSREMPLKPKETLSDLSSYSSSGFSSTDVPTTEHYGRLHARGPSRNAEPTDTITYLKHLHTEIQEIWSLLNPSNGGAPVMRLDEMDFLNNTATVQYNTASGKQCCDVVLPQTTATPTFTQTSAAMFAGGHQPMSNFVQNQHHYTITLLEKTRDLKNWLRQAKTEHEILKKQTHGGSENVVPNMHR